MRWIVTKMVRVSNKAHSLIMQKKKYYKSKFKKRKMSVAKVIDMIIGI